MAKSEQEKQWRREEYARNKDVYRERASKARQSRKRFLDSIKRTAGCVDCGYAAMAVALEFDHVRGVKFRPISDIMNHSWDTLVTELMKCDVRCSNCHQIITAERQFEYNG